VSLPTLRNVLRREGMCRYKKAYNLNQRAYAESTVHLKQIHSVLLARYVSTGAEIINIDETAIVGISIALYIYTTKNT